MKGRVRMAAGFAAGYYLGARAGERRHRQLQHLLARLVRSGPVKLAAGRARGALRRGWAAARRRPQKGVQRRSAALSPSAGAGHGGGGRRPHISSR